MLKNNTNNDNTSKTVYSLKLVQKTANGEVQKPYFEVRKKSDESGKYEATGETSTQITGKIASLTLKEETYEGNVNKKINFFIVDEEAEEGYFLDFHFNATTRSLFNALLSVKNNENLSISVYRAKKDGRLAYSLKENEERVSWKFDFEALPSPIVITHPSKKNPDGTPLVVSRDYEDINNFFIQNIKEWADEIEVKLNGFPGSDNKEEEKAEKPKAAKKAAKKKEEVSAPADEVEDDEIPF